MTAAAASGLENVKKRNVQVGVVFWSVDFMASEFLILNFKFKIKKKEKYLPLAF